MKHTQKSSVSWRHVVVLVVLVLAVYVLVPQFGKFHSSIQAIKDANFALLLLAFGSIMLAVLSAALTYSQLVFKSIPYTRIVSVQYAGMFINRLVPAGVGGISLFIDFLYRQGHSLARSSAVVAMNTGIGLVGHFLLVMAALVVFGAEILPNNELQLNRLMPYIIAILLTAGVVAILLRHTKPLGKISTFFHQFASTLSLYRSRKLAVSRALACAMMNTLFHALALSLAMKAFGLDLPIAAALIVLTGGVFAATVTPTPGGIIGAEAGLTAVLISYGVDSGIALAVALSYRLVSYWLPIIPGILAFTYIQKRRYI